MLEAIIISSVLGLICFVLATFFSAEKLGLAITCLIFGLVCGLICALTSYDYGSEKTRVKVLNGVAEKLAEAQIKGIEYIPDFEIEDWEFVNLQGYFVTWRFYVNEEIGGISLRKNVPQKFAKEMLNEETKYPYRSPYDKRCLEANRGKGE